MLLERGHDGRRFTRPECSRGTCLKGSACVVTLTILAPCRRNVGIRKTGRSKGLTLDRHRASAPQQQIHALASGNLLSQLPLQSYRLPYGLGKTMHNTVRNGASTLGWVASACR
jgi:hypothetical protein